MRAIALCAIVLTTPLSAADLYVRGGISLEQSGPTTILDRDCTSTAPPALFGCGNGIDGLPLAARGDFGSVEGVDVALGTTLGDRARAELAFTSRELHLDAFANFIGVRGVQSVRAGGGSDAVMANVFWTAAERHDVQPFVFAGAGAARNTLDRVHYAFPSIDANAVTITRGGSHTGFAWNAGAGASFRVSRSLAVDVMLRYTDAGDVETDAGEAAIVRPNRTLSIAIDGTRGDLELFGLVVGVRWLR